MEKDSNLAPVSQSGKKIGRPKKERNETYLRAQKEAKKKANRVAYEKFLKDYKSGKLKAKQRHKKLKEGFKKFATKRTIGLVRLEQGE